MAKQRFSAPARSRRLGAARPVHIMAPSATVRRIVNKTALAVVDAVSHRAAAV